MFLKSISVVLLSFFAMMSTAAAVDEVKVGSVHVSISEECLMTFFNPQGLRTEWQFPADGPCYLSKDRKGRIAVYQHFKDNSPDAARLILAHSSKRISKRECESQSVAVMVKAGRVLVSLPPYPKFSMCIGPKSSVDQKNYAAYWFVFEDEGKYMELPFR